jgi:hypothetical protein
MNRPKKIRRSSNQKSSYEDFELSAAQNRELERRVRDLDDPRRYVLFSKIGDRIPLYYDVSTDCFVWKDIAGATLFKRRNAAVAIKKLLDGRVGIIEVEVSSTGKVRRKPVRSESKTPKRRRSASKRSR